jgi:predicted TIM-barrel fold metal-dependent hydrolase
MIIDVNAALGAYPFRRLTRTSAAEVVALMDRSGIDRAVVSSLPALLYRDVQRANEELRGFIAAQAGRFVPVATINPTYAGWERDLERVVRDWKWRAVALAPGHHDYRLSDAPGRAALARIAELGVPVVLTQRLEDRRQRHAWDRAEDLQLAEVLAAAKAFPTLRMMLVNWAAVDGARLAAAGLRGRCLVDFARLQVLFRKEVPRLMETLGPESVAFGSHLPFDYVAPSLVKLDSVARFHAAHHEAIAWRNAARFLGLA